MARNIGRGLDLLAGEASKVLYGERARKDALLRGHLQRSQEKYLQQQRQAGRKELQQQRLAMDKEKLLQRGQQFNQELEFDKLKQSDWKDLKLQELELLKQRNANQARNTEKQELRTRIDAYNRDISQLNNQLRNTTNLAELGFATQQDIKSIQDEIKIREIARDRLYTEEKLGDLPKIREEFIKGKEEQLRQLSRMYNPFYPLEKNKIGDTPYPNAQGSKNDWPQYEE